MKLKTILTNSVLLSSMLLAGGDIAPVEAVMEESPVEAWHTTASFYMWGS